jgi:hypothetical protein
VGEEAGQIAAGFRFQGIGPEEVTETFPGDEPGLGRKAIQEGTDLTARHGQKNIPDLHPGRTEQINVELLGRGWYALDRGLAGHGSPLAGKPLGDRRRGL